MTDITLLPVSEAKKLTDILAKTYPQRLAKAEGFHFAEDRLRSLAAVALLLGVLGLTESDILTTPQGKPYAATGKRFSLSHSGDYAALAVSDTEIGVDLEKWDARHLPVAKRVFTPDEQAWFGNSVERFFILWTMKESLVKATGEGLSRELKDVSVLPLLEGKSLNLGMNWYGRNLPFDGYGLSVCTAECFPDVRLAVTDASKIFKAY